MKWKRTKKGSKEHAKDGKPVRTDEDDQTLEVDERDESDSEDNFNIQVDSPPNPDIDEPPALEVKTEREESNPFHCSQTKRPDLLSPQHFLANTNFTRFNHCLPPPPPPPPFTLRQNPFLRRETEVIDNQN